MRKCALSLKEKKYKSISLLTDSQHLTQIANVKTIFEECDYEVIIGKGKVLSDGQVFGCEFLSAHSTKNQIDAYIFLGQSMFHSASIAIVTGKPTYMLDPYFQQYSEVSEVAEALRKKAILSVYKTLDSEKIGIIIGLKEGQFAEITALKAKKDLSSN